MATVVCTSWLSGYLSLKIHFDTSKEKLRSVTSWDSKTNLLKHALWALRDTFPPKYWKNYTCICFPNFITQFTFLSHSWWCPVCNNSNLEFLHQLPVLQDVGNPWTLGGQWGTEGGSFYPKDLSASVTWCPQPRQTNSLPQSRSESFSSATAQPLSQHTHTHTCIHKLTSAPLLSTIDVKMSVWLWSHQSFSHNFFFTLPSTFSLCNVILQRRWLFLY